MLSANCCFGGDAGIGCCLIAVCKSLVTPVKLGASDGTRRMLESAEVGGLDLELLLMWLCPDAVDDWDIDGA